MSPSCRVGRTKESDQTGPVWSGKTVQLPASGRCMHFFATLASTGNMPLPARGLLMRDQQPPVVASLDQISSRLLLAIRTGLLSSWK
jgi:hypothetical protein